jgi:tetratricopeptide (TPR) repeat protein
MLQFTFFPAVADTMPVNNYDNCIMLVQSNAKKALSYAQAWKLQANSSDMVAAIHCSALALSVLGHNAESATALSQVAISMDLSPRVVRADVYAQAADAWILASDLARAHTAINQALTLDPRVNYLIKRANIYALEKDWDRVRIDASEVLSELPTSVDALILRATALRNLGYPKAALVDAEHAIASAPHDLSALLERGYIKAINGDIVGGCNDWRDVIHFAKEIGHSDDPSAEAARYYLNLAHHGDIYVHK